VRCDERRFSALIEDGRIVQCNVEEPGTFDVSDATTPRLVAAVIAVRLARLTAILRACRLRFKPTAQTNKTQRLFPEYS
jgi:hypothetical protein